MPVVLPNKYNSWNFPDLRPSDPEGRSLSAGNFRREGWKITELFIREYLQNVLDNRSIKDDSSIEQASVEIKIVEPKENECKKYLSDCLKSLEPHLEASGNSPEKRDFQNPNYLFLKETGTTGIGGEYNNSRADGDWAAFFHGDAKETKGMGGMGKNGRAGQGKATYHMISYSRAILAFTHRECDKKSLLMGKCQVQKTHNVGDKFFTSRAFWGEEVYGQPLPFEKKEIIEEFENVFDIEKSTNTPGTIFIIPFPVVEVNYKDIIKVILQDFFIPILKKRLIINVNEVSISADTFFPLAAKYCKDSSNTNHQGLSLDYLKFVKKCLDMDKSNLIFLKKKWNGSPMMQEDLFSIDDIETLRKDLGNEKIVWVRFKIDISRKDSAKEETFFDVYLKNDDKIEKTEEAYIRTDLYIGKEKRLTNTYGKSFGLVLAEDQSIANFLGDAEEASHLSWNATEEKVIERYRAVGTKLRIVRNSLPKLYQLLKMQDTEKDEELLADFLSVSNFKKKKKLKKKTKEEKPKSGPDPDQDPKPPVKEYFVVEDTGKNGIIMKTASDLIPIENLPVMGSLKLAYENVRAAGDAFGHYHPFDFDLSESVRYPVITKGVKIHKTDENIIDFEIIDQDFNISVSGFNEIKQVISKVKIEV